MTPKFTAVEIETFKCHPIYQTWFAGGMRIAEARMKEFMNCKNMDEVAYNRGFIHGIGVLFKELDFLLQDARNDEETPSTEAPKSE